MKKKFLLQIFAFNIIIANFAFAKDNVGSSFDITRFFMFLPMLFIFAVIFISITFASKRSKRNTENLKETASRLGLQFKSKQEEILKKYDEQTGYSPYKHNDGGVKDWAVKMGRNMISGNAGAYLEGNYSGYLVKISNIYHGSGKNKTVYTRFDIHFPYACSFDFSISKQNFFSGIGLALTGTKDIEIGDPDFDKRYVIKGSNEETIKSYFNNSMIKSFINRLFDYNKNSSVDQNGVHLEIRGRLTEYSEIREILERLISLTKEIQRNFGM